MCFNPIGQQFKPWTDNAKETTHSILQDGVTACELVIHTNQEWTAKSFDVLFCQGAPPF